MKNRYIPDWDRYASLARQAAAEGAVLLKNDGKVLPLREGEKLAVFGRTQFEYYKSGTGSGGMVNTKYVIGISEALKEESFVLNQTLSGIYQDWLKDHPFDQGSGWAQEPWSQAEMPLSDEAVKQAAGESDTALIVIGRTAGEDRDAGNQEGSYLLTAAEEEMLRKVCQAFSRTVVLLNVGNIIDMKWVETYNPSAVLYVWQGGMEGGHGITDILTGRVSPCGRLADTIARDIEDYPSTRNFGGDEQNIYAEDIYVGYRYFETFAKEKVLYPFGYGMSYTSFSVDHLRMERKGDCTLLGVVVKNTGEVPGKEVVQAYVNPAQGKLGKPLRNLCAFAKTDVLKPGETEEILFTVSDRQIASYDDSGAAGFQSCYVLEAGNYEFYVGKDVREARLAGSFVLEDTRLVEQCTEALAPADSFSRLRAGGVCQEDSGSLLEAWEDTPVRSVPMKTRIAEDSVKELAYTGDQGYLLKDVYDGKINMEQFLAQIPDEELCYLVKGEGMCSPKVTPGTAAAFGGLTEGLKKFGIPCGCCADGPSGIRMDCGTKAFSLPNGTCLACTFHEKLLEDLYEMEGAELRKNRIDTLLGPGINIHRNPLNGRNFEYFSEDPYLTGWMAAAQLKGMAKCGVTGTIKHFAANNQEHNRRKVDAAVSERALREIYLKGFEIAVKEGKAYSIMTTYGPINGVWTAGNYDLLTLVLRKKWKFDGMVMTDWWADANEEGGPASTQHIAEMVKAQNDVFMVVPDTTTFDGNLKEQLAGHRLSRGVLARSAANICRMLMKSPVMDRSLGRVSEEEKKAWEEMDAEDRVDFDMEYRPMEEELVIPGTEIDTEQGSSTVFGLSVKHMGDYSLSMRVRSDAGAVAQIPVSIFWDGHLSGTVTINGTDGKWIEVEQALGSALGANHFVKFYFAQGGMEIENVKIQWKGTSESAYI
ncbi:MAG: beta-glucosidase [Ruminococcus sp.]|nr:beta-glucosidase [Ruminococcus sp.]